MVDAAAVVSRPRRGASSIAATTPISPEPTPGANSHEPIGAGNPPDSHGPVVEPHPVAPKTAPARSALIAGAAGLAIVAGALGFGAGYITGQNLLIDGGAFPGTM